MTATFADTYYYLALLSPDDAGHERAVKFFSGYTGRIVTTGWVLTELADALIHPKHRVLVADFLTDLSTQPTTIIEPLSNELMAEGLRLFAARPDKHWSLTDCISFFVMQREGIADALTADHHFEQAGFRALLK